jgi:hypothetical protein
VTAPTTQANWIQRYGKPLAATVLAAIITFKSVYGDNHVDPAEGVAIALSFANAGMVYLVPLFPGYRWLKTAVGVLIAALTALATVILSGLTTEEVILVVLAAAQAAGITVAPAVSTNGTAVGVRTAYGPI